MQFMLVHLDHGDEETCYDCIKSGFYSSVMIDASHEDFETNITITKRIVEAAHAEALSLNPSWYVGGVEEHVSVSEANAMLTDPNQAKSMLSARGSIHCSSHWYQPWRL